MFEQFRRTALAAACLPALSSASAQIQNQGDLHYRGPVITSYVPEKEAPADWSGVAALGGALFLAIAGTATVVGWKRRAMAETIAKVPEFEKCIHELAHFNALHGNLSGMDTGVGTRVGKATEFPNLPYREAFQKAWDGHLIELGLRINVRQEELHDRIMHAQLELSVNNVDKVAALLRAYANPKCPRSKISNTALAMLSDACQTYVVSFLTTYGPKEFPNDSLSLATALRGAGRDVSAGTIEFYRSIFFGNAEALRHYGLFRNNCISQTAKDGDYYISPRSLSAAVAEAEICLKLARFKPELEKFALHVIDDLELLVARLEAGSEYEFRDLQDEEEQENPWDNSDTAGGCAVAEETEEVTPREVHDEVTLLVVRQKIQSWKEKFQSKRESVG
ncbi:MAG: hypothetical protein J0M12_10380 [Deltaproteobacteria bacterium]|nr:hypothetical protein [Deltaproteobacteria bacterium]